MDQMIRKLYVNMKREEAEEGIVNKEFQKEILQMLKDGIEGKDESAFEKIRDVAFMIGAAGEENGFVKGFKYAYQLFAECIRR